jgi:hypothetical protein
LTGAPRASAALAIAFAALAFAACGEQAESDSGAQPVGEVQIGSVAPLAQCRDWNRGSRDEKLATIEDIREQVNLQDAPVEGPALTDEQAYRVFENACEARFAATFRLYKLYARAAAFEPLVQ